MAKPHIGTERKRWAIMTAYGGEDSWVRKVSKMPSIQVYAIYDKLVRDGMISVDSSGNFSFKTREAVNEEKKRKNEQVNGHQVTLDEFLKEVTDGIRNEINND